MSEQEEKSIRHLNVNEIFGPTVQGEGPHTGRFVGFLRLAGCNLACSWCDTPYSWDWERYDREKESHRILSSDVAEELDKMVIDRLIVTGGEPLLQQRGISHLKTYCPMMAFEIESNGTIPPREDFIKDIDLFTISPKLGHSGDSFKDRIKATAMTAFAELAWDGKAVFKFVVKKETDLNEVLDLARIYKIPREAIWIMPEGLDAESHLTNLRYLADAIIDKGWNISTRLHVLTWGHSRKH
jgi:organic radical activating enzyme